MPNNQAQISVAIITLNEEDKIGKCIDTAWQVADEIVVVDSFSTDRTKEICLEKGAVFVEHKFEGYGAQKNYAINQTSSDYILSLDADEILSNELINSIRKIKQKPNYYAYTINRMSFYVDKFIKHGHWFPDKKIRLFHREAGKWTDNKVHELFALNDGIKAPGLKGVLYHYTYNSIFEHVRQANNFSEIGANDLQNENLFFLLLKAIFSPFWNFVFGYIARLGFLDGRHGLAIAVISSTETFLKYTKAIVKIKSITISDYDVIHISSMTIWRGGEQQVANLALGQRKTGLKVFMMVSKNSALMKFCFDNKIPFSTLKFGNGFNVIGAFRLKYLCKLLKIKIIHMHCSPSHTLSIFSNLFGNQAKLILSRRVIFPVRPNYLSYQKFNYKEIEKIICVSKSTKEVLQKTVKSIEKLEVIYDGIDFQKLKHVNSHNLKEELGLEGKQIIGNVSAVVAEKDYFTFVDVAEIVLNKVSNVHFVIVGFGIQFKEIQNYINDKKLSTNITMLGFREDVAELLSIFNVFLMTSTMEGLGSTILDAFASNVPVVATNTGGIPEIVIHNKTGLLAQPKDCETLASHVIRFLTDETLVDKISKNAQVLTSTKFSSENMVNLTNNVYKSVIRW